MTSPIDTDRSLNVAGKPVQFFAADDIARMFDVSKDLVFKWIRGNELASFRVGHTVRVSEQSLADFIEKNENQKK